MTWQTRADTPLGVWPYPWQECRLKLATIIVCHVQQADHDSIKVADRQLWLTLLFGVCTLKDRKAMQLFGIAVDAHSMG